MVVSAGNYNFGNAMELFGGDTSQQQITRWKLAIYALVLPASRSAMDNEHYFEKLSFIH